jgi:hypothetical protein
MQLATVFEPLTVTTLRIEHRIFPVCRGVRMAWYWSNDREEEMEFWGRWQHPSKLEPMSPVEPRMTYAFFQQQQLLLLLLPHLQSGLPTKVYTFHKQQALR